MSKCIKCSCPLSSDDIGLHKKLINRGAKEFLCKKCLAEHFKCDIKLLDEKIKQFKESGCVLFFKTKPD